MIFGEPRAWFQDCNTELGNRLKDILKDNNSKVIIAVADNYGNLDKYTEDAADTIRRYMIPEKNQHCIDSWRKKCPDYEIIQWDETNYDIKKNQYMYDAYVHQKWGFVPDYARLDIIYKYGGIYLDTDVEMLSRPDKLLGYDGFYGSQRNYWINLGVGFGAKKGNEYILQMLNEYSKYSFIKEDGSLNLVASPYYQTSFWIKQGLNCNNELQIINNNIFIPTDFYIRKGMRGEDKTNNKHCECASL